MDIAILIKPSFYCLGVGIGLGLVLTVSSLSAQSLPESAKRAPEVTVQYSSAAFPLYEKLRQVPQERRPALRQKLLNEYAARAWKQAVARYPWDKKQNLYLQGIVKELNPLLPRFFPKSSIKTLRVPASASQVVFDGRTATLGVFGAQQSINAHSYGQALIIDSLLPDYLQRWAAARVFYKGQDAPYNSQLAEAAAQATWQSQANQSGEKSKVLTISSVLPDPPKLSKNEQLKADLLYRQMIIPIVCHEVSHCVLNHAGERLNIIEQMNSHKSSLPVAELNKSIRRHLQEITSPALEKAADRQAASLAKALGCPESGFIEGFKAIEACNSRFYRPAGIKTSHLEMSERLAIIREVYSQP